MLNEKQFNILKGKALVGMCTKDEVIQLINYIDYLEAFLDEADNMDTFGTEGWRHALPDHMEL